MSARDEIDELAMRMAALESENRVLRILLIAAVLLLTFCAGMKA